MKVRIVKVPNEYKNGGILNARKWHHGKKHALGGNLYDEGGDEKTNNVNVSTKDLLNNPNTSLKDVVVSYLKEKASPYIDALTGVTPISIGEPPIDIDFDTAIKLFGYNSVFPFERPNTSRLGKIGTPATNIANERKRRAMKQLLELNRLESNKHALGGDLQSNGADWDLGFTTIGNGGTHEMNPNEGVQMGMDNQGIPNLVEQGEVIYNNYVFSNRLVPSKEVLKQFQLPLSFANKTFAQVAELISRESRERPNDPITKRGLDANMQKLLQAQEVIKQQEQDRRMREAINRMSPEELQGLVALANQGAQQQTQEQAALEQQAAQEQMMAEQQAEQQMMGQNGIYARGGRLVRKFKKADGQLEYQPAQPLNDATITSILNALSNLEEEKKTSLGVNEIFKYFKPQYDDNGDVTGYSFDPTLANMGNATQFLSSWANRYGEEASKLLPEDLKAIMNYNNSLLHPDVPLMSTWMQYAPYLADMADLAYAYFAKPNKAPGEAIQAAADAAGQYTPISYNPIGNDVQYTPIDRTYMMNRLAAQANAQRRALTSLSNGNRGTTAANILAADYANTGQLGNVYVDALNTNWQRMQDVAKFNRETNLANSQMALEADKANQSARQAALNSRLSGTYYAQAMLNQLNEDYRQNLGNKIAAPFMSAGRLGERNVTLNKERTTPANRGVWIDSKGEAHQSTINVNPFDAFFNGIGVVNPETRTANGNLEEVTGEKDTAFTPLYPGYQYPMYGAYGGYIRKNKKRRKRHA